VDPLQSVSSAHQIAEVVRLRVLGEVPAVSEVLVHVDTAPHDVACPLQEAVSVRLARSTAEVEAQVEATLAEVPGVLGVSSVLVHYLPEGLAVQVQASFAEHLTVGEARPIAAEAVDRIVRASSDVAWARVVIDPGEQWDGETPLASSVTEKARS
jgi:divalent metal cation (Fe/Co/Zn/Cd) transporter